MEKKKYTKAEAEAIIEKFIAENQNSFLLCSTMYKHFDEFDEKSLQYKIRSYYNKTVGEYFTERGVICPLTQKGYSAYLSTFLEKLKERYKDKEPAENSRQLAKDNPDIDFSRVNSFAVQNCYDFDPNLFIEYGILKKPEFTNEEIKTIANKFRPLYLSFESAIRHNSDYSLLRDLPIRIAFEKFPEVFGMSAKDYLISKKIILSDEKAKKEAEKTLNELSAFYSKTPLLLTPQVTVEMPTAKRYDFKELAYYYFLEGRNKGLDYDEAVEYATEIFLDAEIFRTKSDPNPFVNPPESEINEDFYEIIDNYDVNAYAEKAGILKDGKVEFPHSKTILAVHDDTLYHVIFKTYATHDKLHPDDTDLFDAKDALNNILSKKEVVSLIENKAPGYEYCDISKAKTQFKNGYKDDKKLAERRMLLLESLAVMMMNRDCAEALVRAFPKEQFNSSFKDDTTITLANSFVASYPKTIYTLTAKSVSSTELIVSFTPVTAKQDMLTDCKNDFVVNNWQFFKID